jgi:hypothetical protein
MPASLSGSDLEGIRKVIYVAISKDITSNLDQLPEAKELSQEARALLHSLTRDELLAMHSLFEKLKKAGAERRDIEKWIL